METSSYEPGSLAPADDYAPAPIVSAGSLIGRTFGVYFRNILPLLLVSAVFHLPGALLAAGQSGQGRFSVARLVELVLSNLLTGVLAYFTFMKMSNKSVSIGQAISVALRNILPIFGASIVMGIGTIIGFIFLFVPGVILSCMWAVTLPAIVVERVGVFRALGRSAELTKGSRWSFFGASVGIGLMFFIVLVAIALLTGSVRGAGFTTSWWMSGFQVAFGPIFAILSAIAYHDLRLFKEGTGLDELTSVFE